MHPLLQRLIDLDLPAVHHALFGSGPLLVRGWIEDVGDLDVVSRGPAWERAKDLGTLTMLHPDGVPIVEIAGGRITVGTSWRYGQASVDDLIDTAEIIEGIPCVLLEHVIAYKRIADRLKDRAHLEVIERRLGRKA
jgi:hypothetical protein